jgi:ribonuclease P protein component
MEKTEEAPASILVSVSKKRFKRAVKRNRIKRQVREAYRKNKHRLLNFLDERNDGMAIAFIYLANELVSTDEMERLMKTVLAQIVERSA